MNTSVKITVLVDTESFDENLAKEHGFSAWIETEGRHILFDTGQTGGMLENAKRLGIDLKKADTLVLSHGHFDHTGQIPQFLELNDKAEIYCCYVSGHSLQLQDRNRSPFYRHAGGSREAVLQFRKAVFTKSAHPVT